MRPAGRPGRSTETRERIRAPRAAVYRALLDPVALAHWRVPDTMTGQVHRFDAREGGTYRMSLVYEDRAQSPGGKTSEDTDAFRGTFVELVPDERIVEVIEFETDDPGFGGVMTVTTSLVDVDTDTEVTMRFEHIPAGVRLADNELGTRQSLRKLAQYLEGGYP